MEKRERGREPSEIKNPMPDALAPVIEATAHWLAHLYPAPQGGALNAALVEHQARHAVRVAAWRRYPTDIDAELLMHSGPGGSEKLDRVTEQKVDSDSEVWRELVDERVASDAANFLADPELAQKAVDDLGRRACIADTAHRFRWLLRPDAQARQASKLLRRPDLTEPVASLHRRELYESLGLELPQEEGQGRKAEQVFPQSDARVEASSAQPTSAHTDEGWVSPRRRAAIEGEEEEKKARAAREALLDAYLAEKAQDQKPEGDTPQQDS